MGTHLFLLRLSILCLATVLVHGEGRNVGEINYDLSIKTSNWWLSGTDESVGIQLAGELDNGPWKIINGDGDRFEKGRTDHFSYSTKNIGQLIGVNVKLIKKGKYLDKWKLDHVYVKVNGSTYRAYFHKILFSSDVIYPAKKITAVDCASGFQVSKHRKYEICEDVNECDTFCVGEGMVCNNYPGSYTCNCSHGFNMVEGQCKDVDECRDGLATKCLEDSESDCVNSIGSYSCQCKKGFYKNPKTGKCVDEDECYLQIHNCQHTCTNTKGSFQCGCRNGWNLQPDNRTCIDANECEDGKNPCDPNTSTCYDLQGSFECICKHGYTKTEDTQKCEPVTCKALKVYSDKIVLHPHRCHEDGATKKGEICNFSCKRGYELKSNSASYYQCSKSGYFQIVEKDKFEPLCKPTKCPIMEKCENGYVIPQMCTSSGIHHGGECHFYCKNGYKLHGESKSVKCFDRMFDKEVRPKCVQLPEITCPDDITLYLPQDGSKAVFGGKFQGPITNMRTFETEPKNVDENYAFAVGNHQVQYKVSNGYGDEKKCSQVVRVVDNSAPMVKFCPSDIHIELKQPDKVLVKWPEPVFQDNIGINRIISSQKNNQLHAVGFNVVYTAIDTNNNAAKCMFKVHIDVKTCSFDQMKGGDQGISKLCHNMGFRSLCMMYCPDGKTFHRILHDVSMINSWFCSYGEWQQSGKIVKRLPDCVDFIAKPTNATCDQGFIQTIDYRNHQPVCGKCPRGTQLNDGDCLLCPKNHYQDEEGQLTCRNCPQRTGTSTVGSIQKEECKKLCELGTYSKTGFPDSDTGNCTKCPKDTYNGKYGSKECHKCPIGSKTEVNGASDISYCIIIKDVMFTLPNILKVNEGDQVQLTCLINSKENVNFGWRTPCDRVLSDGSEDHVTSERNTIPQNRQWTQAISKFTISRSSLKDDGIYTCMAEYEDGQYEHKKTGRIRLVVNSKYENKEEKQ